MRALTESELAILRGGGDVRVRVLLDGNDLTALSGRNWLEGVEWGAEVDDSIGTCTVTLSKAIQYLSLHPLNTANRVGVEHPGLLRAGAQLEVLLQLGAGAWRPVGLYRVDMVSPGTDTITLECSDWWPAQLVKAFLEQDVRYGSAAGEPIEDVFSRIITRTYGVAVNRNAAGQVVGSNSCRVGDLVTPSTPNGWAYVCIAGTSSSGTMASWTAAQEPSTWPTMRGPTVTMGTGTFELSCAVPLLHTPVSPGWVIGLVEGADPGDPAQTSMVPHVQERGNPWEALEQLAAGIGWVLRQRWDDGTGQFRLTFEEPDRAGTAGLQWQLSPSSYTVLSGTREAAADVRNVVKVSYFRKSYTGQLDAAGKEIVEVKQSSVTLTDLASIRAHERRFAEIALEANSVIDTQAEATALATAALSDLKEPSVHATIEAPLLPFLELGDSVELLADGEDLTSSYTATVSTLSHSITMDVDGAAELTTELGLRLGPATAGTARWHERLVAPGGRAPVPESIGPVTSLAAQASGIGALLVSWQPPLDTDQAGRVRYKSTEVYVSSVPGFTPSEANRAKTATSSPVVVEGLTPGVTYYVTARARDYMGNLGASVAHVSGVPGGITGGMIEEGSIPPKALMERPTGSLIQGGYGEFLADQLTMEPEGQLLVFDPVHSLQGHGYVRRMTAGVPNRISLAGGYASTVPGYIRAAPGDGFCIELWARLDTGTTNAGLNLQLLWTDGDGLWEDGDPRAFVTIPALDLTTTWKRFVFSAEMPTGRGGVQPYLSWNGSTGTNHLYIDCISVRKQVGFDLVQANTLRTSNYQEAISTDPSISETYGQNVATAGVKVDSQGTAIKIAPENLWMGKYPFRTSQFKLLNGIGGGGNGDGNTRIYWKGDINDEVDNGYCNGDAFFLRAMSGDYTSSALSILPYMLVSRETHHATSNLSGLRAVRLDFYTNGGVFLFDRWIALPQSRGYNGADSASGNRVICTFDIVTNQLLYSYGSTTPRAVVKAEFWNVNGAGYPSFYVGQATPGNITPSFTNPFGFPNPAPPPPDLPPGQCVVVGTQVHVDRFTTVPVESLRVGDYVYTRTEGSFMWGVYPVTHHEIVTNDCYELSLIDGRKVAASINHRFCDRLGNWIQIQDLEPGTHLDGLEWGTVDRVAHIGRRSVVHMSVDEARTFVACGILSHNMKST